MLDDLAAMKILSMWLVIFSTGLAKAWKWPFYASQVIRASENPGLPEINIPGWLVGESRNKTNLAQLELELCLSLLTSRNHRIICANVISQLVSNPMLNVVTFHS